MKRPRLSSFLCLVVAALFSACATEPNLFTVVTVTPPADATKNGPTTPEPTTALPFPHNIVLPDQYRYAKILDLPDPKIREVVAKDLKSTLQANGFSDETISLFDLGGLAVRRDFISGGVQLKGPGDKERGQSRNHRPN